MPRHHYAYVNCVDRFTPKLLFEDILNQFAGVSPSFQNGVCRNYARCDNEADFILKLEGIFAKGRSDLLAADTGRILVSVYRMALLTRILILILLDH
jgi:hypothetical protein